MEHGIQTLFIVYLKSTANAMHQLRTHPGQKGRAFFKIIARRMNKQKTAIVAKNVMQQL
jgi:hypothetical protein